MADPKRQGQKPSNSPEGAEPKSRGSACSDAKGDVEKSGNGGIFAEASCCAGASKPGEGVRNGPRTGDRETLSGMQAAAYAAYALSEVATIFPITPASHMSEQIEEWSASGKKNLMGQTVKVKEMQSEKGAAGAMHGALAGGALASTFTASQGLMLMIPNMYKISGELLPGVFHVTCRSLSAHALSIFGDHQDLMAARSAGVAMLGSASVQECMDLSLVAHLSAIEGSLPFVHFMDGFRTSDEIETVEIISQEDMADLVNWDAVREFRGKAMDPLHPMVRGTAQNSDIYFQNREAANTYYEELPQIVERNMDKVGRLTGRNYKLFDYVGAPDAEYVIVTMGSSCDVVEETVNYLNSHGGKTGCVKVRLFRPFAPDRLISAVPESAKVLCALDRTKEPGSQGEPLLQDVCMAVLSSGRSNLKVVGGRYGLSSKDFTPTMASAVFLNMEALAKGPECHTQGKTRFTVGIEDDLTQLSLPEAEYIDTLPEAMHQAVFYGFGSDGTVGANKQAARLLAKHSGKWVQEYSCFDSKKSGGLTINYLRLASSPVHSPYLIKDANYIACHKDIYVERCYPMADDLAEGGTFVINSAWSLKEMDEIFPPSLKRAIASKKARLYNIDAAKVAHKVGLGNRINMVMETVYLKLCGIVGFDVAADALKVDVGKMYAGKGQDIVQANIKAIDEAVEHLQEIDYPQSWAYAEEGACGGSCGFDPDEPATSYDPQGRFVQEVLWPVERLRGDALPTSAFDPAGFAPLGGSAHEKRKVAQFVPRWDASSCIQCFECSFVCPHAAIRPYVATAEESKGAPASFETAPASNKKLKGMRLRIQNYVEDCVGCGSCAYNCPAPGKALFMEPIDAHLKEQRDNLLFAQENISLKENLIEPVNVVGTQLRQPLLEFSSACAGCGETPHVKLLTQLFGDRLIIANATGCSSIWGGYMPAMPYCKNLRGHGPAWGNSLFEDNAEYGYGIMKAVGTRREKLTMLADEALGSPEVEDDIKRLLRVWLDERDDPDLSLATGDAVLSLIRSKGRNISELERCILDYADMFQKKSVWAVGGDGWAFDIDYGGLDEVLASGENINVLVLDTEGYSNTGGEMSKATQLGSVSTFSLNGKDTPKKRLARMAMQYDYVYVAQVCFGADKQQLITALREAEAFDGPSLVVALCPCISWGIKAGMGTAVGACKDAVSTGYWTLWRFNPDLMEDGKEPLIIDSAQPEGEEELRKFLMGQNRFASLAARSPELSRRLQSELAKERAANHAELEKMSHWA